MSPVPIHGTLKIDRPYPFGKVKIYSSLRSHSVTIPCPMLCTPIESPKNFDLVHTCAQKLIFLL